MGNKEQKSFYLSPISLCIIAVEC